MEGYQRNRFYLSELIHNNVMLIFIQEHWMPHNQASDKFSEDFPDFKFLTTSSDMFLPSEDMLFQTGPVWHGTALGWPSCINNNITKLPIVSERFCGVHYEDIEKNIDIISYCAYLPTAGQDEEFTETLSLLSCDISNNRSEHSTIIIGWDSNQSKQA